MAQAGFTPISLYYSTTAAAAPIAGNLTSGELAINTNDGKLFYKDSSGVVKVIAGTGGSGVVAGSNTQIQFNNSGVFGASANLTWNGTNLSAGGLALPNGTANGVLYLNGSLVATSGSALTFDGTNLATTGTASATKLIPTGGSATGNGMYLPAANALAWSNNGVETMRLDASGNLGIGQSANLTTLDIRQNTTYVLGLNTATRNYSFRIDSGASDALVLGSRTTSTDMLWLTTSGNLGIGTASPTTKLHVSSTATEVIFQDSDTAKAASLTALLSLHGSDGRAGYIGYPADSSLYINNQNNTPMLFLTNNTERMRLDASGNLGLGVTPSAWNGYTAIQMGAYANFYNTNGGQTGLATSTYNNGTNWIYNSNNPAFRYEQDLVSQSHRWYTAPSGTAGNAITFTQAMTLDSSGNLGIGVTSPTQKLDVNGTVKATTFSGSASGLTNVSVASATGTLAIANGGTGSTATAYCALGSNVSGTLPIANGGTGSTSTTYCALGSNVSGTLPVANGGTGVTSSTGTGSTVLSTSPTLVTPVLGTPSSGNLSSCTNIPVGSATGTLPIANGGTGATTAATAFTALKQAATDTDTGVVELATGAEAIAGTDTTRAITPSTLRSGLNASGTAPVYACRAWVNFDGTLSTPISRRAGGNISSVVRTAAGTFTINFATAMPDADYASTVNVALAANATAGNRATAVASTASALEINTYNASTGGVLNPTEVSVVVFR